MFFQARLPAPYYATTGLRIWVEVAKRHLEPEVRVHRKSSEKEAETEAAQGGVAVLSLARQTRLPEITDVETNLQEIFMGVYDAGAFPRVADFSGEIPPPPLDADKRQWVVELLRAKGLRS